MLSSRVRRHWPRMLAVPPLLVAGVLLGSGALSGSPAQPGPGADPTAYLPSPEALAGAAGGGSATVLPIPDAAPTTFSAAATSWGASARYEVSVPLPRPPGVRLPQVEGVTRTQTWDMSVSVSLFPTEQDRTAFVQEFTSRLLADHPNANERAVPPEEADYAAQDFRFNTVDDSGLRRGVLVRLVQERCAAALVELAGLPVTLEPSGVDLGRQGFLERAAALVVEAIRAAPPPCAG
jgi:hypothetical protein